MVEIFEMQRCSYRLRYKILVYVSNQISITASLSLIICYYIKYFIKIFVIFGIKKTFYFENLYTNLASSILIYIQRQADHDKILILFQFKLTGAFFHTLFKNNGFLKQVKRSDHD